MEMPVRVYTQHLDLLYEIDGYSSLQLERNYHDVGNIEIHLNEHIHGNIDKDYIVTLGDSTHKAGIIRSKEIELDESGKSSEEWTLKGPTLQGLMKQRITVPPKGKSHDRITDKAETVMKHYVERNFINPDDNKRKIDRLVIAPDKGRGKKITHESRYKNVADELADISKETGLGWIVYIDFSRRKFVFDVVEGLDLTQGNTEGNNPVFFSPDFGTIKGQSFSDSDLELANYGYVGGQGEGEDRKIVEIGESTGMNRYESFIDARDVGESDDDEEDKSEEDIEKELTERGKKKLAEQANELSLDAEIISPTTRTAYEWQHDGYLQPVQPYGHYERKEQQVTAFVYERDFDLGDIVPVYNRNWGVTMNARITKMKEIHEPGGFRLEATWGKERPTLISKIRDKFDELEDVEKQEIPAQLITRHSKDFDEKLTKEQQERIEQAKKNLEEARKRAEDYTDNHAEKKIHVGPDEPADKNQKWLDTSGSHDKWRRYNHDSSESDDLNTRWPTTDVIDKDTTFAERWLLAKHIESLNGLTAAGGQFRIDENGNLKTSGDITGSTGTFGSVAVNEGDITFRDKGGKSEYSLITKPNLILYHSFELSKYDTDRGSDEDAVKHNWRFYLKDEKENPYWKYRGNPRIAVTVQPEKDAQTPIFGDQAAVVRSGDYFYQEIYGGTLKGKKTMTFSAYFKRHQNTTPGTPRIEIDHIHYDGGEFVTNRILSDNFDQVPDDYSVVRHSSTFEIPDNFDKFDYLELKLSGIEGSPNWVQVDGVQLVEGSIPGLYDDESGLFNSVKGTYSNLMTKLWEGAMYPTSTQIVTPSKSLSECSHGWELRWQAYDRGDGAKNHNYQYTYIPKTHYIHNDGAGFRCTLARGNAVVYKYVYVSNYSIEGHDNNRDGDNDKLSLTGVFEW